MEKFQSLYYSWCNIICDERPLDRCLRMECNGTLKNWCFGEAKWRHKNFSWEITYQECEGERGSRENWFLCVSLHQERLTLRIIKLGQGACARVCQTLWNAKVKQVKPSHHTHTHTTFIFSSFSIKWEDVAHTNTYKQDWRPFARNLCVNACSRLTNTHFLFRIFLTCQISWCALEVKKTIICKYVFVRIWCRARDIQKREFNRIIKCLTNIKCHYFSASGDLAVRILFISNSILIAPKKYECNIFF